MLAKSLRGWIAACAFLGVAPGVWAQPDPPQPAPEPQVRALRMVGGTGSFLGVGIKEIDADRAKELKLREEAGVEITRVEENSPAATAGLKVGDVVVQYNGQHVEGIEQFSRFVRETPPGREVKLAIVRNGSPQTIVAKIGSRKGLGPEGFNFVMPKIEIPPMPDIPSSVMMWHSGTLGIEAEPLRGQLAEFFGVKQGVLVRSVGKNSAAEKAGVKAGDVILKVNDQNVATPGEITGVLRSLEGNKTVPVVVMRDRKELTLNATVESQNSEWQVRPPRAPRAAPSRAVKM